MIYDLEHYDEAYEYVTTHAGYMIKDLGNKTYEVVPIPPLPEPTHEEIKKQREQYRQEHIDSQTLERLRCQANGTWTDADEQAYLALDAEVSNYIETNFPYNEEPVNA